MEDEQSNIRLARDKYRSFLHDAVADTHWRHGASPTYDQVNLLFEEGRTKVYDHFICAQASMNLYYFYFFWIMHETNL